MGIKGKLAKTLTLALTLLQIHAQNSLTNGLFGYYPLNRQLKDVSGNQQDGTAPNGISYVPDRSTFVASFNGTDRFVILPPTGTNYSDYSVTFWLKTSDSTANTFPYGIFLVSRDIPFFAVDWSICLGEGRKLQFVAADDILKTSTDLPPDEWVHVACVANLAEKERKIYINGLEATAKSWAPNTFSDKNTTIFLGASTSDTGNHPFYRGSMGDVRIYDRSLNATEVLQIFANEGGLPCTPHKANAVAKLVNGFVVEATVTSGGCGYTNVPAVLIQGGGGSGAVATATISNGIVTAINIAAAGCCYTNAPTIVIASPPFVPTVSIAVSKVKVSQHVQLGRNYILEASFDLSDWTSTGDKFTADSETVVSEFAIEVTGQYFRLREVL